MPYIELKPDHDTTLKNYPSATNARPSAIASLRTTRESKVKTLICPSDPYGGKVLFRNSETGLHANYAACAGSLPWNDGASNWSPSPGTESYNKLDGVFYANSATSFDAITDGTSNTLLLSEIRVFSDQFGAGAHDVRGRMWNNNASGAVLFSTTSTPNTSTPDRVSTCHALIDGVRCSAGSNQVFAMFARSKHTGGVNVALCDGSVRFVANEILGSTWLNMGIIADGNALANY